MTPLEPQVVVVARGKRWLRLRVRGLLRNAALAGQLEAAGVRRQAIRTETGCVQVPAGGDRDEAAWLRHLSAVLRPQQVASPARPAAELAPVRCDPRPPDRSARQVASKTVAREGDGGGADARHHAVPLADLWLAREGRATSDAARGLTAAQAAQQLASDGPNEILDITGRSAFEILLGQFTSVPVALLGASAGLALATRAFADAAAIAAVLGANATLGFVTERRAEQTVSSLRKLGPRQATVLRDGELRTIDARGIVVGDVLLLRPGEPVAADARVFESHRLATNEAALTGESLPVRKHALDVLAPDTPLGERCNMVFLGTVVSGGAGRAVVVATGERASLGRIRQLAQATEAPRTQLQLELDRLGTRLAIGAATLCVGVFALGVLRQRPLLPLLRTAVSLGVAAIPEGLPTVATSLLAAGIRSLQERHIYARRLDAIENLGAVDTVCFDKTGTLTHNRMSVASLALGVRLVVLDEATAAPRVPEAWLRVAALCNSLEAAAEDAKAVRWQGSSTEMAIVEFAAAQGCEVHALRQRMLPLAVRHRSEHHPYMVTLHAVAGGLFVAVKGRPDAVIARCDDWFDGRRIRPLSAATRRRLIALNDAMAECGHRVLALACREQAGQSYGETAGLTWLGLVGLADPLRPGLPAMVGRFKAAGIRPIMITGDQPATARTVALQAGFDGADGVVDAAGLPENATAICDVVERAAGFARTSPAMKLEIVRALQQRGHVVAMTGDGINDGPALKSADVGVAMGVTGTDFAHAMSDLVLREDHPAAMLEAIEQGRTAFVNVRKSVRYLVATNLSELAATTLAVAAGGPEPFEPLQLLWTNIVTDIWPAIALGLEPAESGILEQPPVSLKGGLLERREWTAVVTDAGVITLASLASFGWGMMRGGGLQHARTMAFMTLTSAQLLYAMSVRSPRPLREGGLAPNPMLRWAVIGSLAAQAGTALLPAARRLLRTTPLGVVDVGIVAATAALPLVVREVLKEGRPTRGASADLSSFALRNPRQGVVQ